MTQPTLSNATLSNLTSGVARPNYKRSKITAGIVHCGVGLLDGDRKMKAVLDEQDCLYTVTLKYPDGHREPSIIGSIVEYLFAPDDPEAVLEKLAIPAISIVSLTITEGGYNFDQVTGTFDQTHPGVVALTGLHDGWPVVCKPIFQWVVEDDFDLGRPPFEQANVQLVEDVTPYEYMKLRLLNASHQALCYFGYLSGHRYAHEAMTDVALRSFVERYMDREATPTLKPVSGIDLDEYKATLIARFSNPEVRDTLARLCAESSDRIPKWLVPVIRDQLASGGEVECSAAIVASWARYAEGADEQGESITVVDSLSTTKFWCGLPPSASAGAMCTTTSTAASDGTWSSIRSFSVTSCPGASLRSARTSTRLASGSALLSSRSDRVASASSARPVATTSVPTLSSLRRRRSTGHSASTWRFKRTSPTRFPTASPTRPRRSLNPSRSASGRASAPTFVREVAYSSQGPARSA